RDSELFQCTGAISVARARGRVARPQLPDDGRRRINGDRGWKFRVSDELFWPGAGLLFDSRRHSARRHGRSGRLEQTEEAETRARSVAWRAAGGRRRAGRAAAPKSRATIACHTSNANSRSEGRASCSPKILTSA